MHRGGDHRAPDPEPLRDVAFHLGAEHELGPELRDVALDLEVVVGDQRVDPVVLLGGATHVPGELAAVGAEPDHVEPELVAGDSRRGQRVGRVGEDHHPLAGEVGGIDRSRVPPETGRGGERFGIDLQARQRAHLGREVPRGADTDRHRGDHRLAEPAFQPPAGGTCDLRIQADVEVRGRDAPDGLRRRTERCRHVDVHPDPVEQPRDLHHVVAAAEAERRRPEQVRARPAPVGIRNRIRSVAGQRDQRPHETVECLARPPVLLSRVRRQLKRHHRHRQVEGAREIAGLVLDELGRARLAHEKGPGLESLECLAQGADDEIRGVATEVARLERGVGHGRPPPVALDHREQEIRVGVALRRVQHVVDAVHGVRDAHRPDVRRSLVGPDRELHDQTASRSLRTRGRANSSARSAACSKPWTGVNTSSMDHFVR